MPGPQLVEPIKALLARLGPGTRDAVVCIPSQLALVRRIPMPKVSPKRLRALVESQGQRFIPFFRDGANFDLVVSNPNLSTHEQEVLLVAVPTPVISRIQTLMRTVGVRLIAVDVDIMAVYRAAIANGSLAEGLTTAVLDVGHRRVRLGLFTGGWPSLGRSLDVVPVAETSIESSDTRAVALDEFAVEVRRNLEIIQGQARADGLAALVLATRRSDTSLVEVLAAELRQGDLTADDFQVIALGGSAVPEGMAAAFGASLAMAVRPYRFILTPRTSTENLRQRRTAALLLLLTVMGAGAYGWFSYQSWTSAQAERERVSRATATHVEYLKREPQVAAQEARIRAFEPILSERASSLEWSYFYPALRALLPSEVVVNSISLGGEALSLSGRGQTAEAVAEFIQRLEDSPFAAPPVLSTYTGTSGEFALSAKLTPTGGDSR